MTGTRTGWTWAVVFLLLVILAAQLILSVRQESQAFDEGAHLYSGYAYWKNADFGRNPEHPPLVKLLAALPLLRMDLIQPRAVYDGNFRAQGFLAGKDFLYRNDADRVLMRGRMAAAVLTLALALLVFVAVREMFGTGAGLIALIIFAFDPNVLAHGALVTTDIGVSLFMFAAIYFFYRYAKSPSLLRLIVAGVATGMCLAAKHSGLLVVPMLLVLILLEVIRGAGKSKDSISTSQAKTGVSRWRLASRYTGSLAAIGVIAIAVLWACYGFRYAARPSGMKLEPAVSDYVQNLPPIEKRLMSSIVRVHVLPEAYLFGLTDVRIGSFTRRCYVLGKVYPYGVWFYFPVVFVIKSTLALLALTILSVGCILMRRFTRWREIMFLTVPIAIYMFASMRTGMNIGVRHILPVYIFLFALMAGAAWALIERNRKWLYPVAALLLLHVASSLYAYPHYLPYSNEAFGGPANTYKYLTDSNTDWAQQLKSVKLYLDQHQIHECWFAYLAESVADPKYYGITCKPLPTVTTWWLGSRVSSPATIDGTVLVNEMVVNGYYWGAGDKLNLYENFKRERPVDYIDDGVFVYKGHFDIPLAAAIGHVDLAYGELADHHLDKALAEAQTAVQLAPYNVNSRYCLGNVLSALNRQEEARHEYETGLKLAQTIEPEYQIGWIEPLKEKLNGK